MTTDASKKKIIITGAGGFLGSALVKYLSISGYDVVPLVRNPEATPIIHGKKTFQCDLPDIIDGSISFVDSIVIHCAFTTRFRDEDDSRRSNILGTRKLIDRASKQNASLFVFISSLSSHNEALSIYGRHKYELEGHVKKTFRKYLIVRPGLIVGCGGLFGRMKDIIRKFHVYPEFIFGEKMMQYIAIEDVCNCIQSAIEKELVGCLNLAHAEKVTSTIFYKRVAQHINTWVVPIPLPGNLSIMVLGWFEKMGIQLPVSSDNLLGLKKMKYFEVTADLKQVGIEPKNLEEIDFCREQGATI